MDGVQTISKMSNSLSRYLKHNENLAIIQNDNHRINRRSGISALDSVSEDQMKKFSSTG